MMNIFSSAVKTIGQWWTKFKEKYFFLQKGDDTLSNRKITFSSSNDKIRTFFLEQNVNLPVAIYNELLGFLSKACTYEEEERRIRPSLIIGNNLSDKHVAKITQATVIPFVKENVEKAHLMKRLKAMLPFCNNGWRVFLSLENEELTYGIMRNFNGPSGLSLDDILANISVEDKESLGLNFVLVDIASNFEIVLKGNVDSCTVDFRLIDDHSASGVRDNFCNDMLCAYEGDISKIATAYRKTISLFPQKLHGSICVIIKHDHILPDDTLKDGIFLETPIDIYPILAEDLNDKQTIHDISSTISAHEKYHAFTGLLLEMLNIDGITVVDNKGRIRAYNVFVNPEATDVENLSGGARKRAANFLRHQKNPNYIGVYFQSQDGMSSYERMESNG